MQNITYIEITIVALLKISIIKQNVIPKYCAYGDTSLHFAATTAQSLSKRPGLPDPKMLVIILLSVKDLTVLLPTGSEGRGVLGVGSNPVAILPSCQNMNFCIIFAQT